MALSGSMTGLTYGKKYTQCGWREKKTINIKTACKLFQTKLEKITCESTNRNEPTNLCLNFFLCVCVPLCKNMTSNHHHQMVSSSTSKDA